MNENEILFKVSITLDCIMFYREEKIGKAQTLPSKRVSLLIALLIKRYRKTPSSYGRSQICKVRKRCLFF